MQAKLPALDDDPALHGAGCRLDEQHRASVPVLESVRTTCDGYSKALWILQLGEIDFGLLPGFVPGKPGYV
jgi:hypothetical protein